MVKEVSRQNVKSATWPLLAACNKVQRETDELKKELFDLSADFTGKTSWTVPHT